MSAMRTSARTAAALIAVVALAAGCVGWPPPTGGPATGTSDSDASADGPPAVTEIVESVMPAEQEDQHVHADAVGEAGHSEGHAPDHSSGHEAPEGAPPPTLAAEVAWSRLGGWDLHVAVTGFRFAPERASTDHVAREGHAHVYVDGDQVGRVYGSAFRLGRLLPGEREVRVALTANDHVPVTAGGEPVQAVVTVTVAGDETPHGLLVAPDIESDAPHPAVSLEVVDDPAGGWNLRITAEGFRIGSAADKNSDGFAVMSIGRRVTRIYAPWHHLPDDLTPGEHTISVRLHNRNGRGITVAGEPLAASAVLTVSSP